MSLERTAQTTAELYKPLDDYLERLKKKIRTEFNHLSLAGFDRLNVMQTRQMTQSTFDRIESFNRAEYARLVRHAWKWACRRVKKRPRDIDYLDYVLEYLNGYDPVTQYIYTREIDRKRMRLNEGILAAREFSDRNAFEKAVKKTADLLYTQSMQYGTDLIQAAMLEVYERAGIDDLMWISVMDGHECKECHDRNGVIYKRRNYPQKPHYGCRCYPVPSVQIP